MPGLNRKGPNSGGAMTGRKMGRCNPDNKGKTDTEILQNRVSALHHEQGKGHPFGKGLGRGLAMRFRGNK